MSIVSVLVACAHSMTTRRLVYFVAAILLLSTTFLLITSASLSTEKLHAVKFDFGPHTHAPPSAHKNATAAATAPVLGGWFPSWKWKLPFTEDVEDRNRVALPPIDRCSIYSYYEPIKDKGAAAVEDKMLLAWRRAWWAQGFKPMILGPAEAKKSKYYESLVYENLKPELMRELMRWLALDYVEGAVLVDHRVLPMGPHDDVTISALRRCQQFDGAIGYKNPSKKLYTTDQKSLDNILSSVASSLTTGKLVNATTIEEVLTPLEKWIKVEPFPKSLADYSRIQVNSTYPSLKPEDLPELVNAHLHSTFLAQYSDGISVLFPFADKLQALYQPALKLADRIAACPPKNPLPDSCPPNIPKCALCKKTAKINSINTLSDSTRTLTLGTIPHPFVTIEMVVDDVSLLNDPESLTLRYIRRTAVRDAWLKEVTKQPYMAKGIGSGPRATKIKELVASKKDDKFLSMWNTEKEGFKDTEWTLGFVPGTLVELNITLPLVNTNDTKTLADASAVAAKGKGPILGAIESWCMGDTEVWRFVNAWRQRRVVERADWTALEKKFGHGLDDDERRWGW